MRMKRPKRFSLYPKNVIHSAQPFPLRMGRGFLPLCRESAKLLRRANPQARHSCLLPAAHGRILSGCPIRQCAARGCVP